MGREGTPASRSVLWVPISREGGLSNFFQSRFPLPPTTLRCAPLCAAEISTFRILKPLVLVLRTQALAFFSSLIGGRLANTRKREEYKGTEAD